MKRINIIIFLFVVCFGSSGFANIYPTTYERLFIETVLENCNVDVNPYVLSYLFDVEKKMLTPTELSVYKGIALVRACRESRFNTEAVGDNGRAIGIFQWWPWAGKYIDRTNITQSIYFLFERINNLKPVVKKQCKNLLQWFEKKFSKKKMEIELFRIAYVRSIRKPNGFRCKQKPREFGLFNKILGELHGRSSFNTQEKRYFR